MKLAPAIRAALLILAAAATPAAQTQSPTIETAFSGGVSTEDTLRAAAAQFRVFGEIASIRYFGEVIWAVRSTAFDSDAFDAAYPYANRVQIGEAYGERLFRGDAAYVGVRVGRYRTPFGIYDASDHAYVGFLRAPLARYEDGLVVANTFLEQGASVVTGVPRLSIEASVAAPADLGTITRRIGTDTIVRAQGVAGEFIVGLSYGRTQPVTILADAIGPARFSGVDVRWMRGGVQLRGEWMGGHPVAATTSAGWYADAIVHRVSMGRVTALGRVEQVRRDVAIDGSTLHASRQTLGARIRLLDPLSLDANVVHTTGARHAGTPPTAIDFAVTYTLRRTLAP